MAYGIVHLLIAWLALRLAWGSSAGEPSGTGALRELAQQPFGQSLPWAVGLGFAALVVWQLIEAAVGHTDSEGKKRLAKRTASGFQGRAVRPARVHRHPDRRRSWRRTGRI